MRCIGYISSPEDRCTENSAKGRKFCPNHLLFQPKKSYHRHLKNYDVTQNLSSELGEEKIMRIFIAAGREIKERDEFIEKNVSLECRDLGHQKRRYDLIDLQQRCDDVLNGIYSQQCLESHRNCTSSEPVSEAPKILFQEFRKQFKATKKRTQKWQKQLKHSKEEDAKSLVATINLNIECLQRFGIVVSKEEILYLGSFLQKIRPNKKERKGSRLDKETILKDPKFLKSEWIMLDGSPKPENTVTELGCFNYALRHILPPILGQKIINEEEITPLLRGIISSWNSQNEKDFGGKIRATQWWEFIHELHKTSRVLILNFSLMKKSQSRNHGNQKYSFSEGSFFIALFSSNPSYWIVDISSFSSYLCSKLNKFSELEDFPLFSDDKTIQDAINNSETCILQPPFNLVRVSRTLVKRIMIAGSLGERGIDFINKDLKEYHSYRKSVL